MTAPGPMSLASATPLAKRSTDLARLVDTTWDVLIVGGGVVGSGALLDAASRGLTAARALGKAKQAFPPGMRRF